LIGPPNFVAGVAKTVEKCDAINPEVKTEYGDKFIIRSQIYKLMSLFKEGKNTSDLERKCQDHEEFTTAERNNMFVRIVSDYMGKS
jgi:hypothetical protein